MELKELIEKIKKPKPGINVYEVVMPDTHTDYIVSLLKLPKRTPVFNLAKMSGTFEQRFTSIFLSLVSDDLINKTKDAFFGFMESIMGKMAPDDGRFIELNRNKSDVKYPIPPFAASIIMSLIQRDDQYPSHIVIRVPHTDLALVLHRILMEMADYYDERLKPLNVILVFDKKNYLVPGDAVYVLDVPAFHYLKMAPINLYRISNGRPLLGYIYARAKKYPDDMKRLDKGEFYLFLLGVVMADSKASQIYYDYLSQRIPAFDTFKMLARFFGIVDEHDHMRSYTFVEKMLSHMPEKILEQFFTYTRDIYYHLTPGERSMFADAIGNVLFFIGDSRYIFYRLWAMRGYRNMGEYTFAVHRGILVLSSGKRRSRRIVIELEKLANLQRYVPPELESWESGTFSIGSPVHMLHYLWMKNVYFEETNNIVVSYRKRWHELKDQMCISRYTYVLTLLLANDVLENHITSDTLVIARELEYSLGVLQNNSYIARDIITYGYLALALYYDGEGLREKAIATYNKLAKLAKERDVYIVSAIAHNNTGVVLGREDLSLRSYERFYRLGIISLIKAGGAAGLTSIAMLNYLAIVKSYEKKKIVDNLFESFRLFVYPKTISRNRTSYYILKASYLLIHGYINEAIDMEKKRLRDVVVPETMLDSYAFFLLALAYKTGNMKYLDMIPHVYQMAGKNWEENRYLYLLVKAIEGDSNVLELIKKENTLFDRERATILKLYYWSKKDLNMVLAYQKRIITYNTEVGDILGVAEEEYEMGLNYKQLGNHALAYKHLRRAYEIYEYIGSQKMMDIVSQEISALPSPMQYRSFVFDAMIMEMFLHNIIKITTLSGPDRLLADILDMLISLTPAYQGIVGIKVGDDWQMYAARDISGNIDVSPNDFRIPWNIVPEHAYVSSEATTLTVISNYRGGRLVIHLEDPMYGGGFEERDSLIVENVAAILPSLIEDMELKRKSLFDSLTGLYARWYLLRRLEEIVNESKRDNVPVSVLFIDVDRFKEVNDKYGHDVGDRLLREIAQAIKSNIRSADVVGRYGGDEMVIVMRHATMEDATAIAERIRSSLLPIKERYPEASNVSVSIGIASSDIYGYDAERLIKEADKAMYKAKAMGKNRIHIAHD